MFYVVIKINWMLKIFLTTQSQKKINITQNWEPSLLLLLLFNQEKL